MGWSGVSLPFTAPNAFLFQDSDGDKSDDLVVDVSNEVGLAVALSSPGTASHSPEEQRVGIAREPGRGIHHMETGLSSFFPCDFSCTVGAELGSLAGSGSVLETSPVRGRGPRVLLLVSALFLLPGSGNAPGEPCPLVSGEWAG